MYEINRSQIDALMRRPDEEELVVPLFYFHHQRRGELLRDPDGSEVPDVVAARNEALDAARELWSSAILTGSDLTDDTFVIAEEATGYILMVPFIDALPERLRSPLSEAYRHRR